MILPEVSRSHRRRQTIWNFCLLRSRQLAKNFPVARVAQSWNYSSEVDGQFLDVYAVQGVTKSNRHPLYIDIVFGCLKTPVLAKILFLWNYLQDCNGYVHPHGIVADQSSVDQYRSLPSYWPRPWWCGLHVSLKNWAWPEIIKLDYSQLENLEGNQNQNQTLCSQTKLFHTQGRLSKARLTQSSLALCLRTILISSSTSCVTSNMS